MPRFAAMPSHASATVLRRCYEAACAGDAVGIMNVLRDVCSADHAAAMVRWRVDGRLHWAASGGAHTADLLLHAARCDGVDAWPLADAEVRGAVWLDYRVRGVPLLAKRSAPRDLLPHLAQALPLCWQRVAARAGIAAQTAYVARTLGRLPPGDVAELERVVLAWRDAARAERDAQRPKTDAESAAFQSVERICCAIPPDARRDPARSRRTMTSRIRHRSFQSNRR